MASPKLCNIFKPYQVPQQNHSNWADLKPVKVFNQPFLPVRKEKVSSFSMPVTTSSTLYGKWIGDAQIWYEQT